MLGLYINFKAISAVELRRHDLNLNCSGSLFLSFSNTGLKCVDSLTPPLRFQVNIKQSIGHGRGVDM